ncbi:hypothetical protein BDB00DRAFT_785743 [Zychaea mexicana]|uniref:uncharacterized protein n=1 Tax=Zychaea mexicana TaxID=64656 RepID=UPI0022FDF452|nr:uncharacterized protein BDB00DRAFT_785743 [Zychaea mexicana]KAI9496321.1 hypothetical protein BDB00DRAFT_785743 [Zychaea mexicana]
MSQPPPGQYDYSPGRKKHRHGSSYFTPADPYRAARKSATPDSVESEAIHSRTGSDSSTSRLAPGLPSHTNNAHNKKKSSKHHQHRSYYDPYDPYAVPPRSQQQQQEYPTTAITMAVGAEKYRSSMDSQQRANSYLPYSHHDRGDPFATPDPVYIEEENLPSFVSPSKDGGVGSLLQDNIAMDSVSEQQHRSFQQHNEGLAAVFGTFVFVIIVAIVWYFVWPRFANAIVLNGADWADGVELVKVDNVFQGAWNVTFTVDNSENWVPTRISNFEIRAADMSTGKQIGTGSTGSMVLPGRQSMLDINVIVDIDYSSSKSDDTTLQNLVACSIKAQNPGTVTPYNGTMTTGGTSFNVVFYVKQQISGITWERTSSVRESAFQCPIPTD